MERHPRLTLDYLLNNDLPVYVKNCTRPRGQITLTVTLPNGKNKAIKIPKTYIPISLEQSVPRNILRDCFDLVQCLNKGVLQLVWPEEAENELNTDEAQEIMTQFNLSEYSSLQKFTSSRVKDAVESSQRAQEHVEASRFASDDEAAPTVSPRVMQLMASATSPEDKTITAKQLLIEVKTLADNLTPVDLSYIIANAPDGQVKDLAKDLLAESSNDGDEEAPKQTSRRAKARPAAKAAPEPTMEDEDDDDEYQLSPEEEAEEEARAAKARAQQVLDDDQEKAARSLRKRKR